MTFFVTAAACSSVHEDSGPYRTSALFLPLSVPMSSPTADRPRLPDDALYIDEPSFFARVAWRQVAALGAVSLAVLAPMLLALLLAA